MVLNSFQIRCPISRGFNQKPISNFSMSSAKGFLIHDFLGRPEIVDFEGLGGPGRPGEPPKRWGASPPTFLGGFPAAGSCPDHQESTISGRSKNNSLKTRSISKTGGPTVSITPVCLIYDFLADHRAKEREGARAIYVYIYIYIYIYIYRERERESNLAA